MPKRLELDYIKIYKTRCVNCNHEGVMETARQFTLGYVIRPGLGGIGGPNYGICILCRKPGLRVIDTGDPTT